MKDLREKIYRLLRWSERYTKTDMLYVAKSGFWLTLGQVATIATSFILSILFARLLSKETFGIYKYILSVAGFISTFSLTGMNTAITRAVSQGREESFIQSLPHQLKWTAPQFLLLLGVALYYTMQGNHVYGICFAIISVCGPLSTVSNSFGAYLQGKEDFKTMSLYSISSTFIYLIAMASTLLHTPSLLFLIIAYFVSTTGANVYFCYRTIRTRALSKDAPLAQEDSKYAIHLSVMNFISAGASQIDSIIVYHLLGPAELAIYVFSTFIPDRIRNVFNVITSAALPRLSSRKNGAQESSVMRKFLQMFILAGITIGGYILFAPTLYHILFPQYTESIVYSQIYSISLIMLPSMISLPALYALRKERALYIVNIGLPVLKILISVVAIYSWGIMGAIVAKIFHYLAQTLLSGHYALKNK